MNDKKLGASLAERLKAAKEELNAIPKKSINTNDFENTSKDANNNANKESRLNEAPPNEPLDRKNREGRAEAKAFITGRFDRKNNRYTSKPFYLLEKMDAEIKHLCKGSEVAVYNYLLFLGLKEVKKNKSMVQVDVELMEENYKD